jgi:hypothetical protein
MNGRRVGAKAPLSASIPTSHGKVAGEGPFLRPTQSGMVLYGTCAFD